jgi:quercetin dioxygenase-like cupin family protein
MPARAGEGGLTMNNTTATLVLALACGIVIGALGNRAASAQKNTVSRVELINADLVECSGKETRLYTAEIGPGVITPRHRHPGHYFSYVIEGSGVLDEDGKSERSLNPGDAYYIHATADMPASWHSVWNTSKTQPLRTLSFLITDKGVPGTVFEKR